MAAAEQQHLDIWPENVAILAVFCRMRTQWNVGMNGAIGLRYDSLQLWLEVEQVAKVDWSETTSGVQIMEHETLRLWREKR